MPILEPVEREVRALCDATQFDRAATAALRGYGPELYSFLAALHGDDADDVFAEVSIRLWRGLAKFAWHSSLRTWSYTIARNASLTFRARNRRDFVPLDDASEVARVVHEIRTRTRTFLRTDVKNKLTELRKSLPLDDQELLILRIDRGLDWNELAQTLAGDELDADALKREAARLRKRFQTLKAQLVERGRRDGLIPT